MKKNGFTLVELLAVIAILAILVIIALPNIMSLFNEAKMNSFTNELKVVHKTAEQQWMNDSMFETEDIVYARTSSGDCTRSLKLSGRQEIRYYIKVNKAGKVVEYYAEDGTYQYSYKGTGLNVQDISGAVQIATITDDNKISISCSGSTSNGGSNSTTTGYVYYIDYLDELMDYYSLSEFPSYTTFYDTYQATNSDIFYRFEVDNDDIVGRSVGFKYNGNVYYIEEIHTDPDGPGTNFSDLYDYYKNVFGQNNCFMDSPDASQLFFDCNANDIHIYVTEYNAEHLDFFVNNSEGTCYIDRGCSFR